MTAADRTGSARVWPQWQGDAIGQSRGVFAQARGPNEPAEGQRSLFSWAEFLAVNGGGMLGHWGGVKLYHLN